MRSSPLRDLKGGHGLCLDHAADACGDGIAHSLATSPLSLSNGLLPYIAREITAPTRPGLAICGEFAVGSLGRLVS